MISFMAGASSPGAPAEHNKDDTVYAPWACKLSPQVRAGLHIAFPTLGAVFIVFPSYFGREMALMKILSELLSSTVWKREA